VSRSASRIAFVIEPRKTVIAAPASASLTGVAPPRPTEAIASTATEPGARDAEHVDRGDHEQRRAGVDAQDPGIGERVARHPLHDRAAEAEGQPHEDADLGPGQPQRPHDQVIVERPVVARDRLEDGPRRDRLGADRDARHDDAEEHRRSREQAERPPPASRDQAVPAEPPAIGADAGRQLGVTPRDGWHDRLC
jgi:hypothetical protein